MKLPHSEHQSAQPIAESIRSVLNDAPIEVELAASLSFFDGEETYDGLNVFAISDRYDKFYSDCANEISVNLGATIYQGRLPDALDWANSLGIEPCFDQIRVWEIGDKQIYLLCIWEDKDCPIVISIGARCVKPTTSQQSLSAHRRDPGIATSVQSVGRTGAFRARVAVSLRNTYFIDAAGRLWAWGYNENGEVGDGTTSRRLTPTQIGRGFASVSAGLSNFAIKADGLLLGWKNTSYSISTSIVK